MGRMQWWVLSFLAAVLLLGSAAGFLWLQHLDPDVAPSPSAPRQRCANLEAPMPELLRDAEATAVLFGAGPKVRLLVDGKAELPAKLGPGEHRVRAQLDDGSQAVERRLTLQAFHPALVHAELTGEAGLTLVWLGAACGGCEPAKVALDFTRTSALDAELLAEAGARLRESDWKLASARLRAVSPTRRSHAAFLRLAAQVYQSTGQSAAAQAVLARVPPGEAHGLDGLLKAFAPLVKSELARSENLDVEKWNLLTQRFSGLLEKFAPEAPGAVQVATSRLSDLSAGFLEATLKKDSRVQAQTLQAGEEAFGQFVRALRRSKPEDCEFQERISVSL
jgi:hypothetical protein